MKSEEFINIAKSLNVDVNKGTDKPKKVNIIKLSITCDHNDGDYITEETEIDINHEYFNLELFLRSLKTLKKLVTPNNIKLKNWSDRYARNCWRKLTLEDIEPLYLLDKFKQDEDWIKEYFPKSVEEYSILDGKCGHDSVIKAYFPHYYDYDYDTNDINNCHTVVKIEAFFIDEDGMIVEIE